MTTKTQAKEKTDLFQGYLQTVKEFAYYKGLLSASNQILDRITAMRDDAVEMLAQAEGKMNAARAALDAVPEGGKPSPEGCPRD